MSWYDWLRNLWRPAVEMSPRDTRPVSETTADHMIQPALSLSSGLYELRVGVVTATGNVREHNEDNFFVPGKPSRRIAEGGSSSLPATATADNVQSSGLPGLFIVADGMGGQLAGEKASEMAVEIIPGELRRRLGGEDDEKAIRRSIRDAMVEANKEILAQSHLVTEFASMGTTVVLAFFRANRAYITGIGDSRAYRLREGRLERLTKDHSLADALGAAGTIKPEEVESHRFRHVLYLYLGSKDASEGPEEIRSLDVQSGDRFLLATDGLTGVVRDEVIAEMVQTSDDPQRTAQALVNRALENRSKDNITCVVIHVLPASSTVSWPGH